jgi:GNAT superfamily N-acetyltransferase
MALTIHQGYLPGCIGRIVELHARYYRESTGFGLPFESKVARELAAFCDAFDGERDGLWLALRDGHIEGSIAIDGSRAGQDGAHLRWFITSDQLRGTGVGTALLTAARNGAPR